MLAERSSAALVAIFLPATLAMTGCAEVYLPRPSPRLAVVAEGGSEARIFKDGRSLPVGDLDRMVRDNPRALEEAETASSNRTTATVMSVLGAVSLGAGTALVVDDGIQSGKSSSSFPSGIGGAGIGLLAGSIVFNVISGVYQANARTHLFNAINIYNDGLEAHASFVPYPAPYGAPVPAPGYRPLPSFQGPPPSYTPQPATPPPPGVPPGLTPSPPPGAPGGALAPVPALPPGALPPPGSQPVPLSR